MPETRGELLICVLNETNYLDEVLSAMLEVGITNATVVESQGMGRVLTQDLPIFAGFRHLLAGSKPYNYTIFAPIAEPEVITELEPLLRDVLAEAPRAESIGFLISLPLSRTIDLTEPPASPPAG